MIEIQTDNSAAGFKSDLRKKYTTEKSRVLDLFCGSGAMYKLAYEGRVKKYHGVDKEKIHDEKICTLTDNTSFVKSRDISGYNVFDLDAYGDPWKLLYLILQKAPDRPLVIFLTDGNRKRFVRYQALTRVLRASENIKVGMEIPNLANFYEEIVSTYLLKITELTGRKIKLARYALKAKLSGDESGNNRADTVAYWVVKIKRKKEKANVRRRKEKS